MPSTMGDEIGRMRLEAGRRVDPATAEVFFNWGQTFDPYGEDPDLPEDCRQIGRNYFARKPESDIGVSFGDLPEATVEALWERIDREGLNPSIDDLFRDALDSAAINGEPSD